MSFSIKRLCRAGLLIGLLGLAGCLPSGQRMVDEEKEPHFLEGKRRVNAMDFGGAIDSFERALQANPHSAAAHFELAVLYDQRKAEPATAIYHYNRFLDAHDSGEKAQRARERILACKQELARTVSLAPVTQGLQRDFDQLIEENRRLKLQVQNWEAYFQRTQGLTNAPPTPTPLERAAAPAPAPAPVATAGTQGTTPTVRIVRVEPRTPEPTPSPSKTHTVRGGETPAAIARRYNVKVEALMAANPRLDARRLQVGQALNIPAQ
jgi:LysM repeat protein